MSSSQQLFLPSLELDFSDGAVEVLDLDGLVVVVDRDHLEELVGTAAIPLTYDRLYCVHGRLRPLCSQPFNSQ